MNINLNKILNWTYISFIIKIEEKLIWWWVLLRDFTMCHCNCSIYREWKNWQLSVLLCADKKGKKMRRVTHKKCLFDIRDWHTCTLKVVLYNGSNCPDGIISRGTLELLFLSSPLSEITAWSVQLSFVPLYAPSITWRIINRSCVLFR